MIRLKLVDQETFDAVIDLSVDPQDERRLASNVYSLAQAWLYRETNCVAPYAVMAGNQVVGFVLLHRNKKEQEMLIWRLMIDHKEQNKGYGKEVLRLILKMAQEDTDCQSLCAHYVIGNHRMRQMLESMGFVAEGLSSYEVKMRRKVT